MLAWKNSELCFRFFLSQHYASMPFRASDMIAFQEGDLVAAKFPEDGKWYRARVFHVLDDEYKVSIVEHIFLFLFNGQMTHKKSWNRELLLEIMFCVVSEPGVPEWWSIWKC